MGKYLNTLALDLLTEVGKRMQDQGISGRVVQETSISFQQMFRVETPTNDAFQETRTRQVRRGKINSWPVPRGKGHRY